MVTLSDLGVMLCELREEPSGLLALLSIVGFLKVLFACPGLLCAFSASKTTLGCHSPALDSGGREIWVSPLLA